MPQYTFHIILGSQGLKSLYLFIKKYFFKENFLKIFIFFKNPLILFIQFELYLIIKQIIYQNFKRV